MFRSLGEVIPPDEPSVAVCLAAFNGCIWLNEQIASILQQGGVRVTIFISADRSFDGTEDWLDDCASKEERIVLLPHGEQFGGAAKNFFRLLRDVDFSTFDCVSFADQDDIWYPDKLVRACDVLQQTGADAYSSNVIAFWPDGRKQLIKKSQPQRRWDFLFESAGPGCSYVMKTHLVQGLQALLRERWTEIQKVDLHDWFAYAFARTHGYKWVVDERPGMLYRQHDKNQFGANAGLAAFSQRARKVLSGWGFQQSVLIAQLVGVADDPFVRRWSGASAGGMLWLALHAGQCRRRRLHRVWFAISCLLLSLKRE